MEKEHIIYDYLGNEIKEGMTVKVIRTKPIFGDLQLLKPKKNGKGFFKPKTIYKEQKECWHCVSEYEVIKGKDGALRYIVDYGQFGDIHWLLSNINWGLQEHDLITIKGVSDSKIEKK
jgi:hypothetical protein